MLLSQLLEKVHDKKISKVTLLDTQELQAFHMVGLIAFLTYFLAKKKDVESLSPSTLHYKSTSEFTLEKSPTNVLIRVVIRPSHR